MAKVNQKPLDGPSQMNAIIVSINNLQFFKIIIQLD